MTTQVTTADMKASADEWYAFPGSADEDKPPYWVARHGTTVRSQVEGGAVDVIECDDVEDARAQFAEETVEWDGPAAPAAPQSGDLIRIIWVDGETVDVSEREKFTVDSVTRGEDGDGDFFFQVSVATRPGQPLKLLPGQYEILSRRVA